MKRRWHDYASPNDVGKMVRQALRPLKMDEPMLCSEWAAKYWRMSPETSPRPGRFRPIPYQPDILDIMTHQDIEDVYWKKSARVGYTVCLTIVTAYEHRHRRRTTSTYFPNDKLAGKHVKSRIIPAMRDVPVFGELGANKKKQIVGGEGYFINGTILRCYGGHTANNFRADDVNTTIFDELDGFPRDLGEGNPVMLGKMRTQASPRRKHIMGTTPTIHGLSLLQDEIDTAELMLYYYMPCPSCHEEVRYDWGDKNAEEGITYFDDDPETACWICPECHAVHDYGYQREMVANGTWRTEDDIRWERGSGQFTLNGKRYRTPKSVGMYLWCAYSPNKGAVWTDVCRAHLDCGDNPEHLQSFFNTYIGEWWKEEVISIEPEPIYERRENYRLVPEEVDCVTFGADVQKHRIEISFYGWGPGEECWALGHHILDGDVTRSGIWNDLTRLINEGVKVDEETRMAVTLGFIDARYCSDYVYAFCRDAGNRYIYPCQGATTRGKPIFTVPRRRNREHRVFIATVGTDTAKDVLFRRLEIQQSGPAYIHFQDDDHVYDMEFFRQLTGEEKVRSKHMGRWEYHYEQVYRRVETLDCLVYAFAAYRFAKYRRRIKKKVYQLDNPQVLPEREGEITPKIIHKKRKKRTQSRSNFLKR